MVATRSQRNKSTASQRAHVSVDGRAIGGGTAPNKGGDVKMICGARNLASKYLAIDHAIQFPRLRQEECLSAMKRIDRAPYRTCRGRFDETSSDVDSWHSLCSTCSILSVVGLNRVPARLDVGRGGAGLISTILFTKSVTLKMSAVGGEDTKDTENREPR